MSARIAGRQSSSAESIDRGTINARADWIATAPTYREPFKKRRCIVPMTGWYEWQKVNAKTKRPFHFQPKGQPTAFAGVYDIWEVSADVVNVRKQSAGSDGSGHARVAIVMI